MGRVVDQNLYARFWKFFRKLFHVSGDFNAGTLTLNHGKYIYYFDTYSKPASIWLNLNEITGVPVCGGNTSTAGTSAAELGFFLYADIRSESCEVNWFITEYGNDPSVN